MPRAVGIGFYDSHGQVLWAAKDYDGPDPAPLVAEALARVPPATTGRIDGFSQDHEGAPAYVFRLRGNEGEVIAVALLLTRDGENRAFSLVHSLVLPALECLQRELEARTSVEDLTRDLQSRDEDLELLLKMAPSDPASPMAGDELGVLVQTCVDHLGCHLGALVVPERSIAICKAPHGERPQVELLTKIHRHLLNWAQLQRRNLVINKIKVRPIELPPYKILCTPVRHASGRVSGFLALFRAEDAPGFEPRTERLVELLSRKIDHHAAGQLRPADVPAHAPGVRDAGARPARGAAPAGARVRAVPRHRPRARGQRQLRHACRRRGDRQGRRGAAQETAARRARGAHRGRPVRGVPARLHARVRAADRGDAAPPVRGAHLRARRRHGAGLGQRRRGRAAARLAEPARARARQRRDRLQGGEGPRPQPRRDLPGRATRASSGAAPTSWWSRRCTRRLPRTASRCSRSRSCRSTRSARSRASSSCCAWSARTASSCRRRSSCPRPSATSCCPRSTAG